MLVEIHGDDDGDDDDDGGDVPGACRQSLHICHNYDDMLYVHNNI